MLFFWSNQIRIFFSILTPVIPPAINHTTTK